MVKEPSFIKAIIFRVIDTLFKISRANDYAFAACVNDEHFGVVSGSTPGHIGDMLREMESVLSTANPELHEKCFGKKPELEYIG